jgi:hypothetical protein
VRNDREKPGIARLVVALGDDFESANAAAMYHARLVVRNDERASGEEQKELQAAKDGVKAQWMENWLDGLTYCKHNSTCLSSGFARTRCIQKKPQNQH